LLAASGATQASVVLIRHHVDATPATQAILIEQALAAASDDLAVGAIATLSRGRLRVRPLPLR
jgi:hypothetical protein